MNDELFIVHRSSFIVMWNDRLRLAESVEPQWHALTADERAHVKRALEQIDDDPISGAPLFEPLRGYWSIRLDGLRIIYQRNQSER